MLMHRVWVLVLSLMWFFLPGVEAGLRHPGVVHTKEDLMRIRKRVAEGREPWKSGFERLRADRHSSADYEVKGGFREFGASRACGFARPRPIATPRIRTRSCGW